MFKQLFYYLNTVNMKTDGKTQESQSPWKYSHLTLLKPQVKTPFVNIYK